MKSKAATRAGDGKANKQEAMKAEALSDALALVCWWRQSFLIRTFTAQFQFAQTPGGLYFAWPCRRKSEHRDLAQLATAATLGD